MENYRFFQNKACKYFPCHETEQVEHFNCLFCFCPLYALGIDCGGNFSYTNEGIKDCSDCRIPHYIDNYEKIVEGTKRVVEMVKNQR